MYSTHQYIQFPNMRSKQKALLRKKQEQKARLRKNNNANVEAFEYEAAIAEEPLITQDDHLDDSGDDDEDIDDSGDEDDDMDDSRDHEDNINFLSQKEQKRRKLDNMSNTQNRDWSSAKKIRTGNENEELTRDEYGFEIGDLVAGVHVESKKVMNGWVIDHVEVDLVLIEFTNGKQQLTKTRNLLRM